jgi:hypothetical protein
MNLRAVTTLLCLLSGGSSFAKCPTCVRDWHKAPAIAQLDGVAELWVLSDVHGDYAALTALLAGAQVIGGVPTTAAAVEWRAGAAALVVVGDCIDKGPDAPDVVRLLMALQRAAQKAGGHVIVTMGNHEAEFLADPSNSHAAKNGDGGGIDAQLTAAGLSASDTAAGKNELGAFIRAEPLAARVDDWFFVHAGNTGGRSLAALEQALESGVDDGWFAAPIVRAEDSLLEARLDGKGPQWWDASGDAPALLRQWTAALNAHHLVMGHQPGKVGFADGGKRQRDELYVAYSGLLFLIDTGMSAGVDHTGGALLHIEHAGTRGEHWEEVLPNGDKRVLPQGAPFPHHKHGR